MNSVEHVPVLLDEILQMFQEGSLKPERYLDGTFGRGGHTRAVLDRFPEIQVIAMDRDLAAIEYGREHFQEEIESGRIHFIHANFADFGEIRESEPHLRKPFDLALLDLGVSSPQLDEAERGFSFYKSGPLDMRMDQTQNLSAQEIVNTWSEEDLNELFIELGEIRRPQRVVRAIVADRGGQPFETTQQLSSLIERVEGWHRKGHHPATRYFLALRLAVNEELNVLEPAIPAMVEALNPAGRLAVITFHSLEDRIVKHIFKNLEPTQGRRVNKKVVVPEWAEQKRNPRARSAKLRVFEKGVSHE